MFEFWYGRSSRFSNTQRISPDVKDFEKIKFNKFELINANNWQVNINSKVQIQINKVSTTVNPLLRSGKKSQIDTGQLFEMLLTRNRMIAMQMQGLILAS